MTAERIAVSAFVLRADIAAERLHARVKGERLGGALVLTMTVDEANEYANLFQDLSRLLRADHELLRQEELRRTA